MLPKWNELKKVPIFNLFRLVLIFIVTGIAFYLALKAAALLLPFVLALICAMAMEPVIRRLCKMHIKKRYFPRSIASLLTMLVAGSILGVAFALLGNQIVSQFNSLLRSIPGWVNRLSTQLPEMVRWVEERLVFLPDELVVSLTEEITSLLTTLVRQTSGIATQLARSVWSTAQMLPLLLLGTVMWLVGTFYMCTLRPKLSKFFRSSFPETWMERAENVKKRLFSTMFGYLRAQLLLMLAVFAIIFIGLNILRVEYALVIALVIALADAFPVLGSGLFLNSWAIAMLATGNAPLAIGLFLIYVAVLVGRNLLEPRLVSFQLGIHPLLVMAAMFAGLRLFGVVGLIGGPVLMVILRIVYEYCAQGRTLKQVLYGEPPVSQEDTASAQEEP